jgi:hypothetical protein
MKPTLVVLAAGMGSRYGGLKQIDPVGPHGEVLLDYSVYDALRAGFGRVCFIIRRDIEAAFREHVSSRYEDRVPIDYVYQELSALPAPFSTPRDRTKPWGTGHAVLACDRTVDTPFCVLNADDFYGRRAFAVMADFLTTPAETAVPSYAMVGFRLANTLSEHGTVSRGICDVDGDGCLREVVETTKIAAAGGAARWADADGTWHELSGEEIVSMNIWGFTTAVFPQMREAFSEFLAANIDTPKSEFYIPTVVDNLITAAAAQVTVLDTDTRWFGVTYPDDRPLVTASIAGLIAAGEYPEDLWGTA